MLARLRFVTDISSASDFNASAEKHTSPLAVRAQAESRTALQNLTTLATNGELPCGPAKTLAAAPQAVTLAADADALGGCVGQT